MRGRLVAMSFVVALVALVACGRFIEEPTDVPSPTGDGGVEASVDASVDASPAVDAASDAGQDGGLLLNKTRVIFVSAGQVNGAALGGSLADELCSKEAQDNAAHGQVKGKRFIAWLSTDNVAVAKRIAQSEAPYQTPLGVVVAANFAGLTSGTLKAPINVDSKGSIWGASGSNVWTGTKPTGSVATPTCNNWTNGSSDMEGTFGDLTKTDATWTAFATEPCDSSNHVYCIEE